MHFLLFIALISTAFADKKTFQEIDPETEKRFEREREAKFREDARKGWEELLRKKKAEEELKAAKIRKNARAWQELLKKKEAEDAARAKAAAEAARAKAAPNPVKATVKVEAPASVGYSGADCASPYFGGLNIGMQPPGSCRIDEEKLMKCTGKNKKVLEIFSHYSESNPGVFSVRVNAEYDCVESRRMCRDTFCNNPCVPMFCEFDGKVFARQQMGRYRNYSKEKINLNP